MPLIGRWALSTIASPCSSGVILKSRSFTSGKRIYLNGSGLTSSARQRPPGGIRAHLYTHQLEYRPNTAPSAPSSRALTTIVFGTWLSRVRTGWPGTAPLQNSVLAFGARTTLIAHRLLQSGRSRSKDVTSSVACFLSSVLLVPHISSCDVIVKCANVRWSAYTLRSLRVIPTVYGRSSRAMAKYAGFGRRK